MKDWTADAVAMMHTHRITQMELAEKMGVTNDYVSMILLGKRSPKDAENRIRTAIEEIIKEKGAE